MIVAVTISKSPKIWARISAGNLLPAPVLGGIVEIVIPAVGSLLAVLNCSSGDNKIVLLSSHACTHL